MATWSRMWAEEWRKYAAQVTDWGNVRKSIYDKLGVDILSAYIEEPVRVIDALTGEIVGELDNKAADVLCTEYEFPRKGGDQRFIGKYPIKGIIDHVRRIDTPAGKRLLIIDYKTSKDAPDPDVLRSDPQLGMYWKIGLDEEGEDCLLGIYHLRSNTLYITQRNESDLAVIEQALRQAQLKVDNKLFSRNIGYSCRFCPFRTECLGSAGQDDPAIALA